MRLDDDWMDDDSGRSPAMSARRDVTEEHEREMRFLEAALNLWLAALVVICLLIALGVK